MNCTEAREAMLVAEPSELGAATGNDVEGPPGLGDALAEHLAACDQCRTLADMLTTDLDGLSLRLRARSKRRTMMLAALPIAAVLVATVTVAARRSSQTPPVILNRAVRSASVVSVDVGVGQKAAVIQTADPKTTLIWISSGSH